MPSLNIADPLTWLLAFSGLALLVWIAVRPRVGLGLAVLSLAFVPLVPEAEGGWRLFVWAGLLLYLLVVFLVQYLLKGWRESSQARNPDSGLSRALLVFLLLVAASFPVSLIYNESFPVGARAYFYLRGASPFFFLLLYFLFRYHIRYLDEASRWLRIMLVAIGAVLLKSFYIWWESSVSRLTVGYQAAIIQYFVLGFVLSATQYLYARSLWVRCLSVFLCLFFAVGMAISGARGQVISTLVGVGVLGFWKWVEAKEQRKLAIAVPIALLFLIAATTTIVTTGLARDERVVRLWEYQLQQRETVSHRVVEMREGLNHFAESPLWGKGLGFMRQTDIPYGALVERRWGRFGYVHNIAIYLLMTMGLLGFVGYGGVFWRWVTAMWKHRFAWCRSPVIAAASACTCSLLFSALTTASFRMLQFHFLMSFFMALSFASATSAGTRPARSKSPASAATWATRGAETAPLPPP